MSRFRAFFQRHPAIRDACLWALPAIAFGLVLRVVLTAYQPYAYWGSDSESYYSFAYRLFSEGVVAIPQKRRLLYPILLMPVDLLPGSPLRWLVFFQHVMGLLTLVPLAYVVRKILVGWRWWIVPATVIYAGMPIIFWYEHELLGEAFFFAAIVWTFAAWTAWSGRLDRGDRAPVVWWIFFACLALCVLTKPAARFLWPGIVIGLVYLRAWRYLRRPQWTGLVALLIVMGMLGEAGQASRLLYSSAFPLTVLDSPRHADLKAEIAPMVRASRARLDYYYFEDSGPKNFLRGNYRSGNYPTWQAKDRDGSLNDAMREIALEAIRAQPHLFLYIAVQRTVDSINWSQFKLWRFDATYFSSKLQPDFDDFVEDNTEKKLRVLARAFAVEPVAGRWDFAPIREKIEPQNREAVAAAMGRYVQTVTPWGTFVERCVPEGGVPALWQFRPTLLGWWLILGCVLAIALPGLRGTLGVWIVLAAGYAVAVHLVGSGNPRFFAAAWPPLVVALFAPLDALLRLIRRPISHS
ncbi:MAG TPA: hypothetical protein VIM61_13195 [Chthoniobacterales bacterium]